MASAVRLREDYSAAELRALARRSKNVNQSRRLLSLAAVRDGTDRGSAAKIGGMDRQTLRDWVHRFNGSGLEGLVDNWTEGPEQAQPGVSKPCRTTRGKAVRFADWEITSICPDYLVVCAVLRNQSPLGELPACRENSRVFFGFGPIWRKTVSELTVFSGRYD